MEAVRAAILQRGGPRARAQRRRSLGARRLPARTRGRLTAALAAHGNLEEAKRALQEVFRLQPDFSLAYLRRTYPFARERGRAAFEDALRRAGLKD